MKKKIISNAVMFLVIILFIVFFQSIFGEANSMVGIASVIIGLVISEKDLTKSLKSLTIGLLIMSVFLTIAGYLAPLNPFLGLILSSVFFFFITYVTVEGNKKPYHFPFILAYLFLVIVDPITDIQLLPGRLISLIAGTFIIVGVQYLFNKNTYRNTLKSENDKVINILSQRIERILSHDLAQHSEEIQALESGMNRMMKVTYERRNFNTPLTSESTYRVTEMVTLEKIYHLFDKLGAEYEAGLIDEQFLVEIKNFIEELKKDNPSISTTALVKWNEESLSPTGLAVKEAANVLAAVEQHKNPTTEEKMAKRSIRIDTKSLAFKFAMRLAIALSVSIFITDFFGLEYGRWLTCTLIALVQPTYEESNKKSLHRMIGTALGAVVFLVLFTTFESPTAQMAMVMIASYIGMFIQRYDMKMIVITIQSLGAAIIGTTGIIVTGNRVFYVLLGVVVAFFVNRFLFTIRTKDIKEHYNDLYEQCKNYLGSHTETLPQPVIVDSYHLLEMGDQKDRYQEWLNTSYDALVKAK